MFQVIDRNSNQCLATWQFNKRSWPAKQIRVRLFAPTNALDKEEVVAFGAQAIKNGQRPNYNLRLWYCQDFGSYETKDRTKEKSTN